MRKNPQLPIPMMNSEQSVLDFIREKFITYDELANQLGYDVAANSIRSWLIGRYHPPLNFEEICQSNIDKLNQYSEWKLRYGIFENYPKRKPQGFWEIKETHRYALEWICEQKGWKFPYGLYQLKKDTLYELNVDGITQIYSQSPTRIITTVLPEYEWHIWKFQMTPMEYWNDDNNKKEYLKWFENEQGINKPEDWYDIKVYDLYENFGRTLISAYFNGSVGQLAKFLYPKFKFDYTKYGRTPPSLFDWKNLENVKEAIEKKANELELDFPMGFYGLSFNTHFKNSGIRFKYFGVHSFAELLNKIYPHHTFYEWLFKSTPNHFWEDKSNLIDYMKWLYEQLKMQSLDEWYDINNDIINHYNGAGLLVHSGKNLSELVSLAYPSHHWDVTKFGQKKFTSQKRLFKVLTQIYPNNEILYNKRHQEIINPKTNRSLELDCYIPSLNLAFEYQGSQHNKPNRFFHSEKARDSFADLMYRDKIKKKRCKELGIKLIEVFVGEWDYTRNSLMRIINESK